VQWYEAYAAADRQARFMVGGVSLGNSVGGAGGWLMGAGHSVLSPSHGLGTNDLFRYSISFHTYSRLPASGVDNVIQFTVVTTKGVFLTVNAYQNTDLFWAQEVVWRNLCRCHFCHLPYTPEISTHLCYLRNQLHVSCDCKVCGHRIRENASSPC
jgi:hypothetical protein